MEGVIICGYCWMVVEGSRLFEVIDRRMVFTLMAVAGRECWIVVVYGKSMMALRLLLS